MTLIYDLNNRQYGEDWTGSFARSFTGLGGEVAATLTVSSVKTMDYADISQKILASGATGVLLVTGAVDTAMLCQHLRKAGSGMLIFTSSWPVTPEFIKLAIETKGQSITDGINNLIKDFEKGRISMTDESVFEVGRNIATTEGAVVYENEVMQLIQYAPLTPKVGTRPLVMVPPCINKFYIMDLQPDNSLIRYAVEQGNTVFLVSWRNPKEEQGHLGWDDYLENGPIAALRVAQEITKVKQVNALGFCVGGTILTSALAVLKARGESPVASLTLLTTLLDFSDTGEIGLFIDENGVGTREATIGKGGLLPATLK